MCDEEETLIESLLDEFVDRLRRGETPSIAEYEAAHPQCAEQIREFFPAALMVEQLARRHQHEPPRPAAPERLGDYRIIREIGRGGMGIVYEAEQESLSRRVAVKVLPQSALLNPNSLRRFQRESRTAARLHHTNIIPVFGVGQDRGFHYIVMQLIRGVGLDKILIQLARDYAVDRPAGESRGSVEAADEATVVARALAIGSFLPARPLSGSATVPFESVPAGDVEGPPPATPAGPAPETAPEPIAAVTSSLGPGYWQSVARIGVQAAWALQYAHGRGTLHRDIKPANLLVDLQGVVWIGDFGLAKATEHDQVSQTGDFVGTLRYMAPERFHGRSDNRSDIYSLGLSLYELLTLRPAFEQSHPSDLMRRITAEPPPRPRALNPRIPRDLETIVLKASAGEPDHRYGSAGELADDLECFLDDRPIRARRVRLPERLWRWSRRNRAVASLAGLALALLILVVVVATVGYVRTRIANRQVRDALAGESHQRQVAEAQRQKAETMSELTLAALDDIFEQFVPSRVRESSELTVDDPTSAQIRVPAQPVLSKEAAALLERMLAFYDRLAEQEVGEGRVQRKIADANRRVGDIRRRLGQLEQAEAAYRRALDGYRQLAPEGHADPSVVAQMARIDNGLGDLCWTDRREKQGRTFHLQALALLKEIAAAPAASAEARYELARTYYFLGRGSPPDSASPGRRRDDGPRARRKPDREKPGPGGPGDRRLPPDAAGRENEANLRLAIGILEDVSRQHPTDPDYRHLLACCYRDLPPRPESSPRSPFASADKAIAVLQKLVDDFPGVPDYRHDLSKTYAKLDLRDRPLEPDQYRVAEQRSRKALAISEQLVAEYPNVPDYKVSQVQIYYAMAEVLRHTRRPDDAEEALEKALVVQSSLVRQYPEAVPYQGWKSILQESLARLMANRGKDRQARAILEPSIVTMEQLLKRQPQATYLHTVLGRSYTTLADILTQLGEKQQADEMLRRGRDHRPEREPQ